MTTAARVGWGGMLTRPRRGKVIAGVCAGIARRQGWSPMAVRALFLASFLLPGPQILLYLVMWVVMPQDPPDA